MNSASVSVPASSSVIGARSYRETAAPLVLNSLLFKIETLEKRIQKLEAAARKAGAVVQATAKGSKARADRTPVVAIMAAVAAVMDRPHRIVSVGLAGNLSGHSACPWALQGRMHLHAARS